MEPSALSGAESKGSSPMWGFKMVQWAAWGVVLFPFFVLYDNVSVCCPERY
jgi:hypothetical protein